MKKHLMDESQRLEPFKLYMVSKEKMTPLVASDYCKRILTICREENVDLSALGESIDRICIEYTEGSKAEFGRRSHNAYRAALKKYQKFLSQGGAPTAAPTKAPSYRVVVQHVPNEHFGTIKLYDANDNLIDVECTKDTKLAGVPETANEMFVKCVSMLLRASGGDTTSKGLEIIKNVFNGTFTIDGRQF